MHQQDEAPAGPEPVAQQPAVVQEMAPTPQAPRETATPEDGGKFEEHEITGIFPPMREKEFEALVADIQEHGQFEPIWTYQGKVIDGRHRLRACKQLGMTPRTQEWDGEGSLLEFVIALNLHRRQLKETQRAMIAARMMPKFEEEAHERQKAGKALDKGADGQPCHFDLRTNLSEGRARDQAGKLLSVSGMSVKHACKVLTSGCPALIDAVDHGRLAVSTAAELAALEMDKQELLLALDRKKMRAALRPTPPPVAPAPPLLAGEGVGGRGAPAPESPEQQSADEILLRHFSTGRLKLVKAEHGFRLELGQSFQDDLPGTGRAMRFIEIVNGGLSVVIGKSA